MTKSNWKVTDDEKWWKFIKIIKNSKNWPKIKLQLENDKNQQKL